MSSVIYVLLALGLASYVVAPTTLILGWLRWARSPKPLSAVSMLALLGFCAGTLSIALAAGAILLAGIRGSFPYYDPTLMRIYRFGMLLSLTGIVLSLGGVWRKNTLRWHAPGLSLSMLTLWVAWASTE